MREVRKACSASAVFANRPGSSTREKVRSYVKGLGFTDADIEKFRAIMLENP